MLNSKDELRDISHWDHDYINELINRQEKESIRLEYKSGDWLKDTPIGKCELRKWVTSFANSAGGFFVIGVREKKINGKRLPEIPDGIDKTNFGGDIGKWVEDVILNAIFPHLNPIPRIKLIAIPSEVNKEIVVMWIPQTIAVLHKVTYNGKDHYFHRHNFQVVPMDEWEIRALLFGRKPPSVLEIKWVNYGTLCPFNIIEEGGERFRLINGVLRLSLVNNGLGFGKNVQIGILCPSYNLFDLFNPSYQELEENFRYRSTPVRYKREDNSFGKIILSPQFEQIFDIQLAPKQYYAIKIYEDFLHASDTINYAFNLRMRDYKNSDEIRVNLGVYCLSEDSQNRYFGMEIKLNNFNIDRAELEVKINEYLEGEKIPVSISAI
jgi:hypothetical protein